MCRAALITKIKNEPDDNLFGITLSYAVNSYNKGNKDGFFIKFSSGEMRTLDFEKFLSFIQQNKEAINSSEKIMLHLRMATHGSGEECIHGWKLGEYNCYHNGIVEIKDKTILNDSYDFFKEVTDNGKTIKNIKREIKNRYGSGAFFMIAENSPSYVFSKRHIINIHLLNKNIVVINSNDDIHSFKENILLNEYSGVKMWGLEFEGVKTRTIKTKLNIWEDLNLELEDTLIEIGKGGVTKVIELDTGVYSSYYGKNWEEEKYPAQKTMPDYNDPRYLTDYIQ